MPELPEVENVGLALREHLLGRRLSGLTVGFVGILSQTVPQTRQALLGKTLTEVHRHGKYLILTFSPSVPNLEKPAYLMVHLRMTGQIFVMADYVPDRHVHLTFDFEGQPVHYRDIRKFGRLELVDHPHTPRAIAHVGPDMLQVRFKTWYAALARRKAPLKALLLDQGIAAGLGNIYVDEALFLAGLHPLARPVDLTEAQLQDLLRRAKQVLRLAIKHGGTTFLNFTNFHGKPGNFRRKLRMYGRAGKPCRKCQTSIEKIRIAGRSTCFCPKCQSLPSE